MIDRKIAGEVAKIVAAAGDNEMDQMAAAFGHFSAKFIEYSRGEIELARAMGDEESAVKEYIKAGVMQTAREMYEYCYILVTGSRRSLWDGQEDD